jgi:hypothetical protein
MWDPKIIIYVQSKSFKIRIKYWLFLGKPQKKNLFLVDMSTKAFTPLPPA